jgi:hypothetical protein
MKPEITQALSKRFAAIFIYVFNAGSKTC